jgi:activator of HSP90 ATPase
VGGWHWTERDVLTWAKDRLQALLGGAELPGGFVTDAAVTVTGDATVNNRKAKLIPAYELAVSGTWRAPGGGATGTWALPYLADENADEAPEVTAGLPPDAPPGAGAARAAFLAAAKAGLATRVAPFVAEMAAGGPAAGEGEVKTAGGPSAGGEGEVKAAGAAGAVAPQKVAAGGGAGGAKPPAASAAVAAARPPPPAGAAAGQGPTPCTATITRTERFYARLADIWAALTDERRAAAATGAPATIELQPGGAYRLYGGAVQATVVEATPPTRLVLDWRFQDWPDGCVSLVTLDLSEPDAGTTVVALTQTGVPTADRTGAPGTVDRMESGWRDMVFDRIRRVFGYGVGL